MAFGVMGAFGPIVFSVSSLVALNFKNFNRTTKKRTVRHEVISGKPRTEYLGADLSTVTFDMHFDITYGVQPRAMLTLLHAMAEGKLAYPLVIGGRPQGVHNWCVDQVSETWDNVYGGGELAAATVTVTLTEYVPVL